MSSEVTGRTNASTLLYVNLLEENTAALLPQRASLTVLGGQQGMLIESKDVTCVIGFATVGGHPLQPRAAALTNHGVLGQFGGVRQAGNTD